MTIEHIMQEGFGEQPLPPTLSELVANRYMHAHVLPAVQKHPKAPKKIASAVVYNEKFSRALDPSEAEKLYVMHFYVAEENVLKEELFNGTIKVVELDPANFRVDAIEVTDEGKDEKGRFLTRFKTVEGGSKNYFITTASNGNYVIHAKD